MARPHPKLDEPRSPAQRVRIRLGLTLDEASRLTGGRLSRAQLARMEHGAGSARAWQLLGSILEVPLETILPARGLAHLRQLELGWVTSS
jgi:hypothetical protein